MAAITDTVVQAVVTFVLHVILAIVILIAGFKLINWGTANMKDWKWLRKIDPSVATFLATTLTLVMRIALIVVAALIIGVPGSAFITLFGTAGVAIGLALQGSLSNLAGGLMLMFFRPFSVGDYIKSGDSEGTVMVISAFYTTILTVDNKRIVLPNGDLTNNTLTNFSAEPTRRLDLGFTVAYDSDIAKVREVLLQVAAEEPMVLDDPEPIVLMTEHGENALGFSLRVWVNQPDYKPAEYALLEEGKIAFDRAGISIPYPQMDVHVDKA